jgi:hypothetical protein
MTTLDFLPSSKAIKEGLQKLLDESDKDIYFTKLISMRMLT